MRKLLIILSAVSLISFSAQAFDGSDVSITAGIAANSAVYGATGKETARNESNVINKVRKESGVFVDSHASGFIELNAGEFISLGFEHTPDSISTPTNQRITNTGGTTTVAADFNDLNIAYLKLNIPGGMYFKAGIVETDVDVKESMASGSTYGNVSTEGTIVGLGYSKVLNDRVAIRFEGSYMEFDDVTTSNGVSATGATVANSGRNQIDVSNMEGLTGKVALTVTFGN
tara:strand:+ start:2378 stop:3067 length:690 start_codon:yes stop_codon:yes gene_type:complete